MNDPADYKEESLDPENWDEFRRLAHRMVDDVIDYSQQVRSRKVWQPVPEQVKKYLDQPVPAQPTALSAVYQDFVEYILPYPMGNIHPRFWGWVMGNGTPTGFMAEMLAAAMNPNMGGGDHGGIYVERQVIEWLKEIFSFPKEASGLLVSGASMANLIGLAVARNTCAGYDVRQLGTCQAPHPLVLYASAEVHSCIQKAVELLGLGSQSLRLVPVNAQYEMEVSELRRMIEQDRQNGFYPFCVVASAGTVNTGAVDDLPSIAAICQQEKMWFHVDGAIGAVAMLATSIRHQVEGLRLADSLALDLHKWMYLNFEAGCVLVRQEAIHRQAFSLTPEYLAHAERGLAGGNLWFSDYGVQLTRGFRALKVWFSIKEAGTLKYGRMVEQNLAQARYLAQLIDREEKLERMAPVSLNIVCFRFNPGNLGVKELNQLNQELLIRIHESGWAVPSYTTLNGNFVLRVAIVNHRSQASDFDTLVKIVLEIAESLRVQ
jgi:glutamate/tyrosine decarboxylase-like PLP-dependent enzyme